ncbi:MAG TPA: glycosyltransferase family 2 protein [Candidatus Doudnabacteria bacterium]|nr:glycosyltransferase family 2 protein [Candidatus Doudnabacteria bacterium]
MSKPVFRKRSRKDRYWEVIPGLTFWTVFFGAIILSYFQPVWAAIFIVCFDLYWVLKAINVATHLIASYRRFRIYVTWDWLELVELLPERQKLIELLESRLKTSKRRLVRHVYKKQILKLKQPIENGIIDRPYRDFYHVVVVPFVDESYMVLKSTLEALATVEYPKDRMIILLATEERAGEAAARTAQTVEKEFGGVFFKMVTTVHPDGLPGEIKGKSANASYAVSSLLPYLDEWGIDHDLVMISNLDSDTIVHPQYFARVMYEFLTNEKPYRRSYQPIAIYNNNIWDSPAFIRVVSVSNSFWQFTESSRPNRLRTFSSHSMTLKTLKEVGFWKKDLINEDGFIYWQCYLHYEGDYEVVPLFIPISLDTCLADTFWQTLINQYKQKRRWAYNVEYYPHLIPALLKSKAPWRGRVYRLFQYVEGNFNWATASLLIAFLGWLPLLIGGPEFKQTVIAYNLPTATRTLMTIATGFLIFSVYINLILLPPRPKKYSWTRSVMMYLQWFLVPIVSVVFGSLPAIDAQTRLMFGKYLEFWVTPKARKSEITAHSMDEMKGVQR